jgi:molybdopterin-binding protein
MLNARVEKELREFRLEAEIQVDAGHCLALIGPTGCGKTTLLRTIVGTVRPDRGRIALGDEVWLEIPRGPDRAPEARRVGYLPQDYGLFPHMTVEANVVYGARARGMNRKEAAATAVSLLHRLGIEHLARQHPLRLSGGQRQRIGLARALASRPGVLLLDEPLAALDMQTRGQVRVFLGAFIKEVGLPTIVVTHDPVDALTLGDQIAVMREGKIVQAGSRFDVIHHPRDDFVAGFVGVNLFRGQARRLPDGLTEVTADGLRLYSADEIIGDALVVVQPSDIMLSKERPGGSALNVLDGAVEALTYLGGTVRVDVRVGEAIVVAEVTYHSAQALGLAAGSPIFAIFKAAATRCLQ